MTNHWPSSVSRAIRRIEELIDLGVVYSDKGARLVAGEIRAAMGADSVTPVDIDSLGDDAVARRRMVWVAHSQGGLITRFDVDSKSMAVSHGSRTAEGAR